MQLVSRIRTIHIIAAIAGLLIFTVAQNCSNVGFSSPDGSTSGSNVGGQGTPGGGPGGGGTTPGGGGTTPGGGAGTVACTGAACSTTNPNPCSTVLNQITTPVKLLFVVDTSGSNAGLCGSYCAPTDLNKVMRSGSIQAFFNDYANKPNFYWSFIYFQQTFASALINSGNSNDPIFTSSTSVMQNAINSFMNVTDQGETPYPQALQMAQQAISMDANAANTKYIVVFMSDGMPYPDPGDSVIDPEVQSLVNARPGQTSFNTVFYGYQNDTQAASRLQSYATLGGGLFLNVWSNPTGKDFQIVNTISVPGSTCNH